MTSSDTVLLEGTRHIDPSTEHREYLDRTVDVPDGLAALRLELAFDKRVDEFQLYGALIDPEGRLRGHVQCPGGPGPRRSVFTVASAGSSWGCLDGPITPGRWTVRVDLDRFVVAGDYRLAVRGLTSLPEVPETGAITAPSGPPSADAAVTELTGWARGELHTHSRHSDGVADVDRIVAAGRAAGLGFLAVSDHFTTAHWDDVDRITDADGSPALLHSIEVTSHYGHANVHGLSAWPGTYIDDDGHGFAELAEAVHAQGGLVGVNHPFSGRQAWRRHDAPWSSVDLLEVVNVSQGANNDAAVGLWDRLLGAGHRVVAVAGTDSHDPDSDEGRLGAVTTLVRAAEDGTHLDESAVLARLASGDVCVSRGGAVRLTARSGPGSAVMGGELALDGELVLEVETQTPVPAVLFVFRDGLMASLHPVPAGRHLTSVTDRSGVRGPYRAELHTSSEAEQFWASCERSHASLLSLSNPVWVA